MKIQETIYEMRQQPVVTAVSIIGTSLAIFLIMAIMIMNDVKVVPFAPESNRDRLLINDWFSVRNSNGGESNAAMSYKFARDIYYSMKEPEEVTLISHGTIATLSAPGTAPIAAELQGTDDRFWHIMDFTVIDGRPYDREEFEAGIPTAVITESIARKLFGTTEASGREFDVDHVGYRVSGVVKDVSQLATNAYAEIWVPITSRDIADDTWMGELMGPISAIMLAKDKSDFPKIRDEFTRLHKAYFDGIKDEGYEYVQRERPYDQETNAYTFGANVDPNMKDVYKERYVILTILLLIPAINLSSMTHSRLRRQEEIIGIKRAFGATRRNIFFSLLAENFIITLIAGAIGLIMSLIFAYFASDSMFAREYTTYSSSIEFSPLMVMQWRTFGWALLFCFVLNVISAGLPSILASRTNIVNALSKR